MSSSSALNSSTSINTGLPQIPDLTDINTATGLSRQFIDLYNAIGILAAGIDSYTGNTPVAAQNDTATPEQTVILGNTANMWATADSDIGAGFLVNILDNGAGLPLAQLCDASLGLAQLAQGLAITSANAGDPIQILLIGLFDFGGSVTAGAIYYASGSTGAGGLSTVAPTASGWAVQPVGFGVDGTSIFINPDLNPKVN